MQPSENIVATGTIDHVLRTTITLEYRF